MKKTLLFIAAILMSVSVFAQTKATLINEHFNGSSLPSGWQIIGQNSNWSVSATQNAGGEANEMKLDWNPQFNGMTRLATPTVDLTGVSSVVFSFKHALDNYQGSHSIGIATSSDGGTTWNDAWTQNYSSNGSWAIMQNISTADMGNNSVMFCIYYNGNSYNINDWYFDDIEIFTLENVDAQLASIDINSVLGAGSRNISCTITNKGVEAINEITLSYQIDDNEAVMETFSTNLASLESTQFSFTDPVMFVPGTYNITVNVEAVNGASDDEPSNNTLEKTVGVSLGETQRIPMIEHFSSSTCGPCVSVNTTMLNLCNNNPGMFTYTKYQMNWPGSGDPYYTEEGGTRRNYYGVNAVPQCFLDGQDQGYAAVAQNVLDNHYNDPAFTDIRGTFMVEDNTITVKVDLMSYYDLNTAKVFVSVNEKETHGNVGSNGETSFHHVFMKFLTAANGNAVNIPAGECQHMEFTQDLSGTHVEEMTDLEVSVWIQDYGTKEMLNSHFMYEYTNVHPYPVQNLALTEGDNALTLTWDAPEGSNAYYYNIYLNGELLAENITDTEYVYNCDYGFYVFAVEAIYPDDMTSVKMVKGIDYKDHTSVADNQEVGYEIYPNPANSYITVKGSNIEEVEVYNLCGQKVMTVNGSQNVNVDMSSLTTGVYMVKVIENNGNSTVNKVVKR